MCAALLQFDWSENRLSYQYTYLCMRSLAHMCSFKRGIAPANELCMGCCHTGDNEFELDGVPLGQVGRGWGEVWEGLYGVWSGWEVRVRRVEVMVGQ